MPVTTHHGTRVARDERGMALVLFAMVLVALMVFAAFAVDLGLLYNERRVDQNVADASATSGGVVLLQDQTPQGTVDEVLAKVNLNLGRTVTAAQWAACQDTGRLPRTAASLGLSPATACISFSGGFDVLRVRIPDQSVSSQFGSVIGIDSYTSSAFAEVSFTPRGGGTLPFVVLDANGPGDQVCLRTDGTGGAEPPDQLGVDPFTARSPDPCNEVSFDTHDGGRGTIKPYFYNGCSKPTGNQSIVSGIMAGLDHPLGVFDPAADLDPGDSANVLDDDSRSRVDGDSSCTVLFPNTIDVDTGLTSGLLKCALLESPCNAGGSATDGTDGRLHEFGSGASFIGLPVDDTPLWEYFVSSIPVSAPDSCDFAADGSQDFYDRRAALQHCLANWSAADGSLFVEDIAEDPRFGYVPKVAELGLCDTQPDPDDPGATCQSMGPLDNVHINSFAPVYIDGLYEDRGGICDTNNPATVAGQTNWSIHYPGQGMDCGSSGGGSRVHRVSAYVLPCVALPSTVCDASSNPPFPTTEGIFDVRLSR